MEEQLISFETAKLAKEKGFNIQQEKGYYNHGSKVLLLWFESENHNNQKDFLAFAPTQSLLQKWLYEKHQIWVNAQPLFSANEQIGVHLTITSWKFALIIVEENDKFDVYKGLEQLLQEALKLIK